MEYRNPSEMERVHAIIQMKEQVPLDLKPGKTALIVVDLQPYFVRPDLPLGRLFDRLGAADTYFRRVAEKALPNARQLQAAFRSLGLPVFYTAFGTKTGDGTDLPAYMQGYIAGVLSECCVGLTARDAADRGFTVIIAEDACTGVSEDLHRDFVDSFALVFGHKRTTDEMVRLVQTAERPVPVQA